LDDSKSMEHDVPTIGGNNEPNDPISLLWHGEAARFVSFNILSLCVPGSETRQSPLPQINQRIPPKAMPKQHFTNKTRQRQCNCNGLLVAKAHAHIHTSSNRLIREERRKTVPTGCHGVGVVHSYSLIVHPADQLLHWDLIFCVRAKWPL
jgi:hypothetical protein